MIGADSETHRFTTYVLAPKPVVFTFYSDTAQDHGEPVPAIVRAWAAEHPDLVTLQEEGSQWFLALTGAAQAFAVRLIRDHETIWHHIAFDAVVVAHHLPGGLRAMFDSIGDGTARCTKMRAMLLSIASGRFKLDYQMKGTFSLKGLSEKLLGVELQGKYGPDAWRTRYAELENIPFKQWPLSAQDYALMDAKACFDVYGAQCHEPDTDAQTGAVIIDVCGGVTDELRQTKATFCYELMACEGVRLDPEMCAETLLEWEGIAAKGKEIGRAAGFIRANGKRDMKALEAHVKAAYERLGEPVPMTAGGKKPNKKGELSPPKVKTDEKTLRYSGDESLKAWAEASRYVTYLSKFGKAITSWMPGGVGSNPNALVETGRASWSKPPRQQPPKKGPYRECHVPPPGYLMSSTDYNQIELVALAYVLEQLNLGSDLADDIRNDIDLHCDMAASIGNEDLNKYTPPEGHTHWTYELVVACRAGKHGQKFFDLIDDELRSLAKVPNFGAPGGLGAASLRKLAIDSYDLDMTPAEAKALLRAYKERRPSMRNYFRHISEVSEYFGGDFTVVQLDSGRVRGGCRYTTGCNTYFQGKSADGIKDATWVAMKEMYLDRSSPLFGSRIWLQIHDENLAYHPEPVAAEAADRLAKIMRDEMAKHVPGLPVKAEPALMERWYKKADTVRDEAGKLVVWRPTT